MEARVKATGYVLNVTYNKYIRKWVSDVEDESIGVYFYNRNDLEFIEDETE